MVVDFDLSQVCPRNPLKRGFLLVRGGEVGVGTETPISITEVVVHIKKEKMMVKMINDNTPATNSQNKRHLL